MANEVRIDLVAKGAAATARDIDKVGDAADRTGDDFKGMAAEASALDKAIAATEDQVAKLRLELSKAPDDKGLRKQLRSEERELNYLNRLLKNIGGDGKKIGSEVGTGIMSGVGDALGALPAQIKGAGMIGIAGLAAAALPFLGASLSAAVLGGVGAGGIVGGIAAASQDAQVKQAGEQIASVIGNAFRNAGEPMVAPLVDSLNTLEETASDFGAKLGDQFAIVAPVVRQLGQGIDGLFDNLDFTEAFKAAGPVLRELARELPELGAAVTASLDAFAEGGDGAVLALHDLLKIVETTIVATGNFAGDLGEVYAWLTKVGNEVAHVGDELLGWVPLIGDTFGTGFGLDLWGNFEEQTDNSTAALIRSKNAAEDYTGGIDRTTGALIDMGVAAEGATEKNMRLSDSFDKVFGRMMTLDEATAAYKQGIRDLNKELTEGKRTLDENTQEGHDNAAAVRDQLKAIEDLRKAQIDQGASTEVANAAYERHIAQLRTTLLNLGYNKSMVEQLIGAYARIPDDVQIQLRMPGLYTALQRVRELSRLLGSNAAGRNAAEGSEPVSGRAVGGPVQAGKPYLVGEEGPELVTFAANGTVHTAEQTKAMLSGSSGGSSGPTGGMTEAQLVRLISTAAAAAAAAVVNSARVTMDGREIGRMQADEADTYYRGG